MFGRKGAGLSVCALAAVVLLCAGVALSGVPRKINYQGRLVDGTSGEPLEGSYSVTFGIYDQEEGGTELWSETQPVDVDSNGVFTTLLGSVSPIGIDFEGDLWLEIVVGTETLSPRRELVSVPYAFRSLEADRAGASDSLGGKPADAFVEEGEVGAVTSAMIVGGAGSGLDADMVDGLHSDAFADSGHNHDDRYVTEDELATAGTINQGTNPVDWTKLKGVPADFEDGVDDVGGAGDGHSLDAADGNPANVVYVDNTGEVGLGTTGPNYELHLYQDSNGPAVIAIENPNTGSSSSERLSFIDENGSVTYISAYDDARMVIANNRPGGNIRFHTAGLERVFIDNDGDFGIGTTGPAKKLHVAGDVRLDAGKAMSFGDDNTVISESSNDLTITADDDIQLRPDHEVFIGQDGGSNWVAFDCGMENVGIGTTSPGSSRKMEVDADGKSDGIYAYGAGSYSIKGEWDGSSGGAAVRAENSGTGGDAVQASASGTGRSAVYARGSSGVDYAVYSVANGATWAGYFSGDTYISGELGIGTTSTAYSLNVDGTASVSNPSNGQILNVSGPYTSSGSPVTGGMVHFDANADVSSGSDLLELEMNSGSSADAQFIECQSGTFPSTDIEFRVYRDGDVTADGSFSPGGADMAEMIAVSAGAETVEPGDVLVIDPNVAESTVKSTAPRSTLVAGIYSTKPGFIGSERDWDKPQTDPAGEVMAYTMEELASEFDEIPMAIAGIVPCKVSAENGPIRPGDLLVTSGTPGHAMRDASPGVGTVLGKALGSLESGTGTIKVMVTLQ
jgi:hypothetical protein